MYAGGRITHDTTKTSQMIWDESYNKRYFEMMLDYNGQILLDSRSGPMITGRKDVRYYENTNGVFPIAYRNLLISTGIGMDHLQLPGFSTFHLKDYVP